MMDLEQAGESSEATWFEGGLKFKCTGCGKCCTGSSGYVYLSQLDLERLAGFFKQPVGAFVRTSTQMVNGRRALINRRHSTDCVFLAGRTCTVYDARPVQCRTYPWWSGNLLDPEAWQEAAQVCEGIDHPGAPIISASEIVEQCRTEAENDSHWDFGNSR